MGKTGFQELSLEELSVVNGGYLGLILAAAALTLATFAFGYQIGKDRAEVDRR
ncbi:MAG: class IIb bacteriocin, lactobin A/cerein 7B family [Proteiniphilum sp.]